MEPDEVKLYDIRTSAEMLRLGFTAETRPVIRIDPQEVPPTLRHLIPVAERWAIACDVRRGDYFSKQSENDIRAFWIAVELHSAQINSWLDSLPPDVTQWPEAAIHFMYMHKGQDELTPPEDWEQSSEARNQQNPK